MQGFATAQSAAAASPHPTTECTRCELLCLQLPDAMESEEAAAPAPNANGAAAPAAGSAVREAVVSTLPEVEAYASLLVLLLLTDAKRWPEVSSITVRPAPDA